MNPEHFLPPSHWEKERNLKIAGHYFASVSEYNFVLISSRFVYSRSVLTYLEFNVSFLRLKQLL